MIGKHSIFHVELSRLPFITTHILDALTYKPFPVNWGVKREGYYMMNVNQNRVVNNFENTPDVEAINMLFNICSTKGYSLIMIKT